MENTQSEQTTVKEQVAKITPKVESNKKLAIVLVRGLVGLSQRVRDTLQMLRLHRKNNCVIVSDDPIMRGMLQKVKDVVTWGEVNEDTFKKLVEQRGRVFLARENDSKQKYSYKGFFELDGKKYHKTFALNPPRKGFGRKGIKTPFTMSGALGYRGEKMDDLLIRMI